MKKNYMIMNKIYSFISENICKNYFLYKISNYKKNKIKKINIDCFSLFLY